MTTNIGIVSYTLKDGSTVEMTIRQAARVEVMAAGLGKTPEAYLAAQMPHKPLNVIDNPLAGLACVAGCWAMIAILAVIIIPGATVGSVIGAK